MASELLSAFIDETEALLPDIRSAVLVFVQDGKQSIELGLALSRVESLIVGAAMIGLTDIESAATELGSKLVHLKETNGSVSNEAVNRALDLITLIEESLVKFRIEKDDFSLDVSSFIETSIDSLRMEADPLATENAVESEDSWAEEGFEIDAEMIEVFMMEAEDLLKNIETNLEALSKRADDREALWEIRRHAHTFKGAAGIVGLKQPSELAHRVEDLLDRLAEKGTAANERIVALLFNATECLRAITANQTSPQLSSAIDQLYVEFDKVLTALSDGAKNLASVEPVAVLAPNLPETKEAEPVAVLAPSQPETKEAKPVTKPAEPRTIVRVSLSRLDELVKIVRDMVVGRSVFEQRLNDLERQIDELHNTTRRLQITTSKLEIDFEASMLGTEVVFARNSNWTQNAPNSTTESQTGLFDSLEFDRYTEFHQSTRELSETASDTLAINTALDTVRGNLESLFDSQRNLIDEMLEKLMRIRMVEFGTLSTRLQRAVRVTCGEENKKAVVYIENEQIEVDTQILDALIEPLMHLLRNSVVHGIESAETRRLLGKPETGSIKLKLINEETHIVLTVSDDGRGIGISALKDKALRTGLITPETANSMSEEEAMELIFRPGLTTAEQLSMRAGRGVGMSIVKESIEAHQGTISIDSVPQKGTSFTVRMPLPLAVANVLLVKVNRQTYALPLKLIKHIGEIPVAEIKQKETGASLKLGDGEYDLLTLSQHLGLDAVPVSNQENVNILIVETSGKMCALSVDEILKTEEIVIKSLGTPLKNIKGLLGATILGNGELIPILDLPYLLRTKPSAPKKPEKVVEEVQTVKVLIVDDSPSVRLMTSKIIESAGWSVTTAKDGLEALELLRSDKCSPDVILTDIEMPRMNGYEFVLNLRENERFKKTPVIVITSRSGEKHREKAFQCGVSDYIAKPFDDGELIRLIERLIKPGE